MKHQTDFLELLQIDYEKYPVIAVVGGGGKTSLIYRLTDELLDRGKRVIITTTTHMAGETELPFVRGGDAVKVREILDMEGYVVAAEYEEETGKYASLKEEKLEELKSVDCLHIAHTPFYQEVFEEALPYVQPDSWFIIGGIYESQEKRKWWKEVVADERVGITFDLYDIGLVFFNKNRYKQHYIVNFL